MDKSALPICHFAAGFISGSRSVIDSVLAAILQRCGPPELVNNRKVGLRVIWVVHLWFKVHRCSMFLQIPYCCSPTWQPHCLSGPSKPAQENAASQLCHLAFCSMSCSSRPFPLASVSLWVPVSLSVCSAACSLCKQPPLTWVKQSAPCSWGGDSGFSVYPYRTFFGGSGITFSKTLFKKKLALPTQWFALFSHFELGQMSWCADYRISWILNWK